MNVDAENYQPEEELLCVIGSTPTERKKKSGVRRDEIIKEKK